MKKPDCTFCLYKDNIAESRTTSPENMYYVLPPVIKVTYIF